MVQINFAAREVSCKIVYYGPGLCGKTTNLQQVHAKAPTQLRGNLTSIATEGDRTLFFDFMPLEVGTVAGMRTKLQLYTVPGQVYYNATRKIVLEGVDGIVFVADSSPSRRQANRESWQNLKENLRAYGLDLRDVALVLQFNKRDVPDALSAEELSADLNELGVPTFEAVAVTGDGVMPTLGKLAAMVLEKLNEQSSRRPRPRPAPVAERAAATVPTTAGPAPAPERAATTVGSTSPAGPAALPVRSTTPSGPVAPPVPTTAGPAPAERRVEPAERRVEPVGKPVAARGASPAAWGRPKPEAERPAPKVTAAKAAGADSAIVDRRATSAGASSAGAAAGLRPAGGKAAPGTTSSKPVSAGTPVSGWPTPRRRMSLAAEGKKAPSWKMALVIVGVLAIVAVVLLVLFVWGR